MQRLARPDGLDFLARYPATVLICHEDNRVDVQPNDTRLPKMERLELRLGLPGVRLEVERGAVDPRPPSTAADQKQPFAELWGNATLSKLEVAGGGKDAARKTDPIEAFIPVGAVMVPNPAGGPPIPNPVPIKLDGSITGGSSIVEIGG
ncbi:MAG: hypothetical protein HC933_20005 [Pleurocapsa sp. SU_196_0]|nr:hypothetical protein [Pleurocapsa sp. SU_196_0]